MPEFELATRRVVTFAATYAVIVILLTALLVTVSTLSPGLAVVVLAAALVGLVALIGVTISIGFWIRATIVQTRRLRGPDFGHLGYWAVGAYVGLAAVGYVLPWPVAGGALRVLGVLILIAGVRHTRDWLRARSAPDRPYPAERYDLVTGGEPIAPLAAQPTADDWNAGL